MSCCVMVFALAALTSGTLGSAWAYVRQPDNPPETRNLSREMYVFTHIKVGGEEEAGPSAAAPPSDGLGRHGHHQEFSLVELARGPGILLICR